VEKIAFFMRENPIGVFDSGLGGISVLNHLVEILPHEKFLYVADSAWCPYGTKPYEQIQYRAKKIVDYFLTKNVKFVVVACNTATAAAIEYLRANYAIPFVGMEPAIKPAAQLTQTGAIGVLATENTFNGSLFKETRQKYASQVKVIIQIGCGLVELVENNQTNSPEAFDLISEYTKPMVNENADYIVLGCTHYPFLTETINQIAPTLKVIDPAIPVARRVDNLLDHFDKRAEHQNNVLELFTTGDINKLRNFASTFVVKTWIAKQINL
jgi:glutamate racemase